ncbi:TPA: hypothetical protein ACH3X3_001890 [Trebouxia sp. C0006]
MDRAGGPKIRLGGFEDSEVCKTGKHHDQDMRCWEKVAAAPKSEGAANQAHGNDTRFSMHLLQAYWLSCQPIKPV